MADEDELDSTILGKGEGPRSGGGTESRVAPAELEGRINRLSGFRHRFLKFQCDRDRDGESQTRRSGNV
jgi:hypothetical protein